MTIFLPFINDYTYLAEIKKFSQCTFVSDSFTKFQTNFEIINIHWPEAIFNWKEPTAVELDIFEREIQKWKSYSKLVYTKHDYERVKGTTPNFTRLFSIVESNTDLFIHLGNFSKNLYEKKFPKARHEIIYHPTFQESFHKYTKEEARNTLMIDKEALVIIAPGQIRNLKERKLVLKSFGRLKVDNKVLIATNMYNELRFDFRGRVRLQRFFDVQNYFKKQFKKKYQHPKYLFTYTSLDSKDLSLRLSAADIVLVPRINLLNSGNVLLGLTFEKITIGPRIGNIKEQLEDHNLPSFDPKSIKSITEAIESGIVMLKEGESPKPKEKYLPKNVARQYDKVFNDLIKK